MSEFNGATLLITGGTGSFGSTVLKHFLNTDIGQIRIFSRDEKKQDDMRHELQADYPECANKVKFYIGDVRNLSSVSDASTERPEAMDKGVFVIGNVTTEQVLQAVDLAVAMHANGDTGVDVPAYVDKNVSAKVIKIIQSYVSIINKMVWRKI